MRYNEANSLWRQLMCHHRDVADVVGGSDIPVSVHDDSGSVRTILVRNFPVHLCKECKSLLPDLAWQLAVQDAIEKRLAHGLAVQDIEYIAHLGVAAPALLCA